MFEARHELEAPVFGFHFLDEDGATVFGFNRTLRDGEPDRLEPGQRVRISGQIENPLAARPLLRQLLDLAQPHRRAISRCT